MAKITIETDDIGEARSLLDALETRGGSTPAPAPAANEPETRSEPEAGDGDVDVHGMVWNEEIHATSKAKNADGSWKARKGQAEAAKAAIAAHKAAGGNVEPPADIPAATGGGMPTGMPAAGGGMPGAAQRDMDPPVTQAQLEEKIIGMMQRGVLAQEKYAELLTKHSIDLADPSAVLSTNETLRAALYADCCEIEPEAPGA